MSDMPDFLHSAPTKKSLGQHWLHDDTALQAMCDAVGVTPEDTVLEVGPGLGTLTAKLIQQAKQVVAVEFDADLARDLPKRVHADNLRVAQQDILKFDLTSLPPHYKVAANIPYYLTSKLLRELCESKNHFSSAALLIQKEVAQRVCAEAGDMSILSVSVQFYCQTGLGPIVPAELFTPSPKVDSQILLLEYRTQPLFPDVDTKLFFRIVKAGFAQRRKTLLNSLSAGMQMGREETVALLEQASIKTGVRAQNLTLAEWYSLYSTYVAAKI
ncbi:MAG TPA: 16S rRNA (adenine(1518)-N(6)/adenine(1519)-N(6))-dimethyltransferase RsmA [Candidatus Saccharimonadales bacterium]|nr:16S rRNA (adenine(1518)-N(6)/adenine(1519)-N(6))-dimethyltransferase RsmA [Candidatus Saccharimonadales bacterium]